MGKTLIQLTDQLTRKDGGMSQIHFFLCLSMSDQRLTEYFVQVAPSKSLARLWPTSGFASCDSESSCVESSRKLYWVDICYDDHPKVQHISMHTRAKEYSTKNLCLLSFFIFSTKTYFIHTTRWKALNNQFSLSPWRCLGASKYLFGNPGCITFTWVYYGRLSSGWCVSARHPLSCF